jgi:hypothetical protein
MKKPRGNGKKETKEGAPPSKHTVFISWTKRKQSESIGLTDHRSSRSITSRRRRRRGGRRRIPDRDDDDDGNTTAQKNNNENDNYGNGKCHDGVVDGKQKTKTNE